MRHNVSWLLAEGARMALPQRDSRHANRLLQHGNASRANVSASSRDRLRNRVDRRSILIESVLSDSGSSDNVMRMAFISNIYDRVAEVFGPEVTGIALVVAVALP